MIVKVIREPGDNEAPEVIDELLTDRNAGIERGRNELDEQGFDYMLVTLDLGIFGIIVPGSLGEYSDTGIGEVWRGKSVSLDLTLSRGSVRQTIDVARPLL